MSSTLFAAVSMLARLHRFLLRPVSVGGRAGRHAPAVVSGALRQPPQCNTSGVDRGFRASPATEPQRRAAPPLRVLRVLEAGQHAAHGGRMVISGRMADVCAELDRMVAREAALHPNA